MKAWQVTVEGFSSQLFFYAAKTRSQARWLCYSSAREAGYVTVKLGDIRVWRAPRYDSIAEAGEPRHIGGIDYGIPGGEIAKAVSPLSSQGGKG